LTSIERPDLKEYKQKKSMKRFQSIPAMFPRMTGICAFSTVLEKERKKLPLRAAIRYRNYSNFLLCDAVIGAALTSFYCAENVSKILDKFLLKTCPFPAMNRPGKSKSRSTTS
jgi:hypothetical protein